MKPFYEHRFPSDFVRTLLKIKNKDGIENVVDYCEKNLEFRAEVIFRLATDTMPVTVMSSRLSFFDKMSS